MYICTWKNIRLENEGHAWFGWQYRFVACIHTYTFIYDKFYTNFMHNTDFQLHMLWLCIICTWYLTCTYHIHIYIIHVNTYRQPSHTFTYQTHTHTCMRLFFIVHIVYIHTQIHSNFSRIHEYVHTHTYKDRNKAGTLFIKKDKIVF